MTMNLLFFLLACLTFENKFSIDNDEDGFSVYDGDGFVVRRVEL